jgi:phosphonate metabolism protein PhnN/1,5-bisphosphokinase (PRPP-forming)
MRYGLYFSPAVDSPWWNAGCRWLGRDAVSGAEFSQRQIAGVPALLLAKLTDHARRYGFHATLKAPFQLADGFSEEHLITMANAFCAVQRPIVLEDPQVRPIDGFLALRPAGPNNEIGALEMRCVSYFDLLRATPAADELARRRQAGLSARQESLLQRWGYPYTEEEYRFHMTLTDSLAGVDADAAYAIRKAAEDCFAGVGAGAPLVLDALAVFREEQPGSALSVWRRFPFSTAQQQSVLPAAGRLFFLVGPSGVGKDSLLQWVREHVQSDQRIVFAQRTITRAAHPSESHRPTDEATFWREAAAGHFSMAWQSNDLCYGIGRGIEAELKAGRDVIVNGSREYIPQLRQLFPDAQVIWVHADATQIRARLKGRQRESGTELQRRVDRSAQFAVPDGPQLILLDNSGPLENAGQRLLELLGR